MSDNTLALLILLSILVVVLLALIVLSRSRKKRRVKEVAALRSAWGHLIGRERDFGRLYSLWTMRGTSTSGPYLDNQTWRDLNIDLLFEKIDRTYSLPGEIELYHLLRTPQTHSAVLAKRDRIISLFQTNGKIREAVQLELSRLGRTRFASGIADLLWGELPPRHALTPVYALLAILIAASVGIVILLHANGIFWGTFALVAFGALCPLNMFIHYRTRRLLNERILAIRYLGKLVSIGHRLAQSHLEGLEHHLKKLKRYLDAARAIPRATALLVPERGGAWDLVDILQEYIAILSLSEVRGYYAVIEEMRKHRKALLGIFEIVGELDSLQAIASFRKGLVSYAKPNFQTDGPILQIDGATHPLVPSAVPNSISLVKKGALITGSNMSGKSTFLRVLGVNAVLAQTIFTCPAKSYQGSMFRIVTSLSETDAIVEGKSLYLVEAERLLGMICDSDDSIPVLCLIDEVLCGTNSAERLAASEAILEYLATKNSLVIAATHDIELVDWLTRLYSSYHFADYVDDKGIHFAYQLCDGKATTTNAIRLLEYLGFPSEIVQKARAKAFGC